MDMKKIRPKLFLFFIVMGIHITPLFSNQPKTPQLESRNELFDHFRSIKDPNQRLKLKLQIIDSIPQAQTAVILAERAINLADSLGLDAEKGIALRLSGRAWRRWGNKVKSEQRIRQAIELLNTSNEKNQLNLAYRDLGETLRTFRAYKSADEYLQKALSYFKEEKNSEEIAKTYNRLAAIQFEKFNWGPYYNRYFESVSKKGGNPEQSLNKIEPLRRCVDSLESYLDSTYAYLNPNTDWDIYVSTQIITGAYFTYIYKFEKAKNVFFQLLDRKDKIREGDLALIYINLAQIYDSRFLKDPEKSIEYAKVALELAKKSDIKTYQFMATGLLSNQYEILGNYRESYKFLQERIQAQEEFYITDADVKAKAQSLEYDILQRDQELNNKKSQLFIVIASLGCLLLAFTIFNTIVMAKNRKKEKLLEELNLKNNIISEQNNQLEKLNHQKDTYLSIIAHDLRSPAANILKLSELLNKNIKENNLTNVGKIAHWIQNASKSTLTLLTDLTAWAKSQSDQLLIDQEPLDLQQMVIETLNSQSVLAQPKNIKLTSHIPSNLQVYADRNLTKTILRNLINNAIKFTPQNGSITLQANPKGSEISISVADTGVGMDENIQQSLFDLSRKKIREGTDGEPSTGLGLMLVKNFVEKQGGQIQFHSKIDHGTTVTFTLPAYP